MDILKKLNGIVLHIILWGIYFVFLWGILGPYTICENSTIKDNIFLISMGLLIIPFIWNLVSCHKFEFARTIKQNILIFIYIGIRLFFLYKQNMDITILRTILIEILFFLLMNNILVKNIKSIDGMIRFFLVFVFVCNIATILISLKINIENLASYPFLNQLVLSNGGNLNTIIIRNTNFLGIITGFSLMLSVRYLNKKKPWFWCHLILGLYFLWFAKCRSSQIAVVLCLVAYGVVSISSKIKERHIAYITLTCSLCMSILIGIFAIDNTNNHRTFFDLSEEESQIQMFSTGRYILWKSDINVGKNHFMFGSGSFEKQKENRKEFLLKHTSLGIEEQEVINSIQYFNSHNGYIGLFAVTGFSGLLLFILILFQKIRNMDEISCQKWCLPLSYFFIINLFEDYYLRTPVFLFVCLFFMAIFLGMGSKNKLIPKS